MGNGSKDDDFVDETARRRFFASTIGIATFAAAAAFPKSAMAAGGNSAYQDIVKLGADPTGSADSSPAFALAFSKLPATGGTIYVQGGVYLLNSQLSFADKALNLIGDGSAATVLLLNHTGWGVTFVCDHGSPESEYYPFHMRGFSVAGVAGSPAAGAIAASFGMFGGETGYQSCTIEDIGIGNSIYGGPGGCNIQNGLRLQNIWKSQISNVRMFENPGNGAFITLSSAGGGLCIDNTFFNCFHDGSGASFAFDYDSAAAVAPFQGINIVSPKFLTGATPLSTVFSSNQNPTILNLYVIGGTLAGSARCLDLYSISGAFISGTSFDCGAASATAMINIADCNSVVVSDCNFNGPVPIVSGSYAVMMSGAQNRLNNLQMGNLGHGVGFAAGCLSSFASNLMFGQPNGTNWALGTAAVDSSGTTGQGRNNAQWLNATGNFVTLY